MTTRRILATILTFAMLLTMFPATVSVTAAEPVVSDGIVFNKTAQANSDGTVDITMEAYTTGTVTNTTDSVPADIVLVLDMSGSMDDDATNAALSSANAVLGADVSSFLTTRYGFSDTDGPFFIKNALDEYVRVTFVDYDDSGAFGIDRGHQYYTDGVTNYYPKLASGISASGRTRAYEEKQFYLGDYASHMEVLKEGAGAFIADVAAKNATIADQAKKHRISIVKFATASYYNGTTGVIDHAQAVVGDDRQSNGYNYTQVVKGLTVVDAAGEAELTTALNNLVAGGATAVDYGIQLAEDVLGARHTSEVVGRSEAIIVFTDGSPTHGSGYSPSVAGSAINEAWALKNAGVKIFSIGGANDANSDTLGNDSNAFMHYISNNFPNASYENDIITPGEGSITNGYYMTPSDDKNLEEIFLDIFNQTANSDIIMGKSAGVIDTISPYFTIPGIDEAAKKANITLQVVRKTATDWASTPEAADGEVQATITGNTVTVRGFDFDKNYVSTTPRTVDGSDFYGMKLVITISNLIPDYDEIDLHHDVLTGGIIPTNEGDAAVVDSENKAVATKQSPTVQAKTITYMVDGTEYKSFYRLPGTPNIDPTALVSDPAKEGHTFAGWDRTGLFTMPNDDVVINANFTKNNYNLTYVYSGIVPDDVSPKLKDGIQDFLGDGQPISVPYGTDVTVPDPTTITGTGYRFAGWVPLEDGVVIDPTTRSFTMPANNVTIVGTFEPSNNTAYTVVHHTETLTPNEFEVKETEHKVGKTNDRATAASKIYEGFTFDASVSHVEDTIAADGKTTLNLYYRRNMHTVHYEIDGILPTDVAVPSNEDVYYGGTYDVASNLNAKGYTFSGWYKASDTTHTPVTGTQTMPDSDVYYAGHFIANTNTKYTIHHHLQNVDDNDYTEDENRRQLLEGTTNTTVTATALTITGFHLRVGDPATQSGTIAPDGSLEFHFYYDRNVYRVTYEYEGTVPDGAKDKALLTQENIRYGATVTADTTVPQGPMPSGYTGFVGWYRGTASQGNIVTTFTMPARDVELLGYFIPDDNRPYVVKHFLQKADGSFDDANPDYEEELRGATLQNVNALPLTTVLGMGYTYRPDLSYPSGQIPENGSLELLLYYDRNEYDITYVFEGDVPTSAIGTEPTDLDSYRHGETVLFLGAPAAVAGYTFGGWHIHDIDIISTATDFTMPNRNVTVYGRWTANADTGYKVMHYLENADGTYGDGNGSAGTPAKTEDFTATTNTQVEANSIPFTGYVFDDGIPGTLKTGTVLGDGSLELKLYYKRASFTVTYKYDGVLPTNDTIPLLPNGGNPINVFYKDTVTVDTSVPTAAAALVNNSFHGWTPADEAFEITGASFEMPAHNVVLIGHFNPKNDIAYHIRHFLQNTDGTYPSIPYEAETRLAIAGGDVTIYAKDYMGFEPDLDKIDEDTPTGTYVTITKTIDGASENNFDFYYKRIEYAVNYELDGIQPHGVTATVPSDYNGHTAKYGATVNVKADLAQDGYLFTGWYSADPAVGADDASFTMPNKAVTLKGKFTAKGDTAYKVEYYQQKLNQAETDVAGTNKATDYEKVETANLTGTTGHTATAEIKTYEGFVARTDNTISATIAGDGSTVIKLYYDRVTNPIEYHFYGAFPDHTDAELPAKEENVPFGVKRTVAPKITCDPSHRHEPTDWASPHVAPVNSEFTMPATKVDFYTAVRHIYKVEYDLAGGTGASGEDYTTVDVFAGTVVDVKSAPTKYNHSFDGWKLNGTDTVYNPDDEITVNEDVKLIAQWTYSGGGGGGGGGVTRYTLTYESNGGTEYKNETYNRNTTVQLDKKPTKEGYVFEGWYEDEELTKYVAEVKMTQNITVYAKWVEDNGGAGSGYDTPGSLNGEDHFAYVVGYPDGTVRPNDNISRAEVTAIFFRLLKPDEVRDKNLTSENTFSDVNSGDWHNTPISTMAKLGIVKGRYTDRFVPGAFITRAEFAAICARFDNSEFEVVDSFTDVQGHWAEHDIHEAAAHGWIRGYEDGTFKPDQFITRAEAMTMINRVLNRVPETADDLLADMIIWPDNSDKSVWYYLAVQEATNSHNYTMKNHIYEKWTALKEVTDWTKYE